MEAGKSLLTPTPPPPPTAPTLQRRLQPLSCSVSMIHDQATRAVSNLPTTSSIRCYPSSVLFQQQQDDCTSSCTREDKLTQATLSRQHIDGRISTCVEEDNNGIEQYQNYRQNHLFCQPGFWYQFLPVYGRLEGSATMSKDAIICNSNGIPHPELSLPEDNHLESVRAGDVVSLANKAMIATRQAASLAEEINSLAPELSQSHLLSLDCEESNNDTLIKEGVMVHSRQLLERQRKRRKVSKKPSKADQVAYQVTSTNIKKLHKGLESSDPLKMFFWGPETKQLLTIKEEKALFSNVQDLMRLEEVKQRLSMEFNREPTLAEWARAVGMDCQSLQAKVHSGRQSRNKLIYANFRLVVHLAKQYEGKGVHLQDLMQEGSLGLMRSLEKFKPKAGCRFPSYAYWWIRQSVKKAIFQNSRTARLPENVFALLKKIKKASGAYAREGHIPTKEELAKAVGITVQRLESLLSSSRSPISVQDHAWVDQDVKNQEITVDPQVEIPEVIITKQLMRQHVHRLLDVLTPRERQIIQLRFGIGSYEQKSLAKLVTCLPSQRKGCGRLRAGLWTS